MPKFDDYTQKTTPEDTDITLILDKTANVNKKTPFSGIWTWIVNKMTNAVIQNLQTTNKTVIGSINELNSNTKLIQTNQILTIALAIPINTVRFFYLSGYDASEFNDTPDNTYIFSDAVVFNRNGTTITVILFPTTITSKPVINIHTASSWSGWHYFDGTEVM